VLVEGIEGPWVPVICYPVMRDIPPDILRDILSSYYGPRWPLLAARSWGVTRAHIYRLAKGTRKVSRRRLVLMRDWISRHQFILARQREEQHARIEREYLERLLSLTAACQWLDGILSHPEQPRTARDGAAADRAGTMIIKIRA